MEFLTFAPVPFEAMLGAEAAAHPAHWDQLSRDAGIVSGYSRWMVGLRAYAEAEREAAGARARRGPPRAAAAQRPRTPRRCCASSSS